MLQHNTHHKIFSSWLRETFLSFASQIDFLPRRQTKKKAAQRKYKGIKV